MASSSKGPADNLVAVLACGAAAVAVGAVGFDLVKALQLQDSAPFTALAKAVEGLQCAAAAAVASLNKGGPEGSDGSAAGQAAALRELEVKTKLVQEQLKEVRLKKSRAASESNGSQEEIAALEAQESQLGEQAAQLAALADRAKQSESKTAPPTKKEAPAAQKAAPPAKKAAKAGQPGADSRAGWVFMAPAIILALSGAGGKN